MHPVAEGCVHVVVRFPDCGSVSQVERDTSDVGLVDYVGGSDLECDGVADLRGRGQCTLHVTNASCLDRRDTETFEQDLRVGLVEPDTIGLRSDTCR